MHKKRKTEQNLKKKDNLEKMKLVTNEEKYKAHRGKESEEVEGICRPKRV